MHISVRHCLAQGNPVDLGETRLCSPNQLEIQENKMKKAVLVSIPISIVLACIGILSFYFLGETVSGQVSPSNIDDQFAFGELNVRARNVLEQGGNTNIELLVDEIFATFSTVVASDVKVRIVNSENLYRTENRNGVSETDVVKVVNGLQMKFAAPEFAKTDEVEVRKLRLSLQLLVPQLIGQGRLSDRNSTNNIRPTIVTDMSPAEAVFVALAMVNQKRTNPNYQMTLAERQATWDTFHEEKVGQAPDVDNTRSTAISHAIDDGIANMSPSELLDMPHRALGILGIEE